VTESLGDILKRITANPQSLAGVADGHREPMPEKPALICPDRFDNFDAIEGTEKAIAACLKWAEDPQGWLLLHGVVGCGKTHLGKATFNQINGYSWKNLPWRVSKLLDFWRSRYNTEDFDEYFTAHCEAAFFGLDDLGREVEKDWAIEKLETFLDHRYVNRLPTLITTNRSMAEMRERLGAPIADRVYDTRNTTVVHITAPSYRTGEVWT
jgi:DNA replication protein DnaC